MSTTGLRSQAGPDRAARGHRGRRRRDPVRRDNELPIAVCALQGRPAAAVVVYVGPIEQGQELIRPLRESAARAVDVVQPMPYVGLQSMLDPEHPARGRDYFKSGFYDPENVFSLNHDIRPSSS